MDRQTHLTERLAPCRNLDPERSRSATSATRSMPPAPRQLVRDRDDERSRRRHDETLRHRQAGSDHLHLCRRAETSISTLMTRPACSRALAKRTPAPRVPFTFVPSTPERDLSGRRPRARSDGFWRRHVRRRYGLRCRVGSRRRSGLHIPGRRRGSDGERAFRRDGAQRPRRRRAIATGSTPARSRSSMKAKTAS